MTGEARRDALRHIEEILPSGGCVIVDGVAGIGKSHLLAAAMALGRSHGLAIGAGRATELDRVAPLSTLLTALTVLPGPLTPPSRLGGFREIERLGDAIERFTRDRPLMVVLDDAQWADELTCLALRLLVPGLSSSPVTWLLARRPLPAQAALDRLISEGARRLSLPPLTPGESAELSARLLGAEPGPSVLELAEAAGGNPFLLEEVLTAMRADGRVTVVDGRAAITGAPDGPGGAGMGLSLRFVAAGLPQRFVAAVERRLRDLSPQARRLLEVGAVLRRPFSVHEAAGLLGVPPVGLLATVEEAVGAGALTGEGERLGFRHDLIREAVYGGLSAPVRTALHREAATVLRAEGRPPAELAEHLQHGARHGDATAIRELRAAAEEMKSTAPSAAADLMLRALDLAGGPDTAADAWQTSPGEPATVTGDQPTPPLGSAPGSVAAPGDQSTPPHGPTPRPVAAPGDQPTSPGGPESGLVAGAVRLLASAGRLGEARRLADGAGQLGAAQEADVALGLAEALKHAGEDRAVISRTARVLARPGVPVAARARLLAVQAHALMMSGRIDAADLAAAEAVAGGEPFGQVVGLQARSTVALFRGELAAALGHAEESVRLADAAGGEVAHRHPRLWLGAALVALDRFEEADDAYAVVERRSGALGTAWSMPLRHRLRAELLLAGGRLADAGAEAEAGLRVAEQLSALALVPALLGIRGYLALSRDDVANGRTHLEHGRRLAGDEPGLVRDELRWRIGLFRQAIGPAQGSGWVDEMAGTLSYLILQEPQAAARLRAIPHVMSCVRELADRNPGVPSLKAAAVHAEGRLEEAIELYRAGPRPLGLAAALEEAGQRDEALEIYTACGATRDAARLRGAHGPPRGWAALTPSEVRVARLVAEGLTNREVATALFVSPHTVDSHLRHAFAKLGVNSRVELTRQVLAALGHDPGS
ncbi:helix-turn-helix transcriptional regulator [Nonomuraea sp. CA-143628]|uniref:helix-turn-helix transcriptional regulator n=1 Tax=Nonomuraea sp. CA-143628 TaxID=3239997 RepID=UPI003D94C73B